MNEDRYVRDSLVGVERSIQIADEILRLCYLSFHHRTVLTVDKLKETGIGKLSLRK